MNKKYVLSVAYHGEDNSLEVAQYESLEEAQKKVEELLSDNLIYASDELHLIDPAAVIASAKADEHGEWESDDTDVSLWLNEKEAIFEMYCLKAEYEITEVVL